MKKVAVLIAFLLGVAAGVIGGLLMSNEQRENLTRLLMAQIEGIMDSAPDE